jgi:hypothetical protein
MDPHVTVVVGANESEKTHLLSAIEKGITGRGISRQDFCRYSRFFTVERGKMKLPDFGFEWSHLTEQEAGTLRDATGLCLSSGRFGEWRRAVQTHLELVRGDGIGRRGRSGSSDGRIARRSCDDV